MWTWDASWGLLASLFSVYTLLGAGAVAVAVFVPFIRVYAICAAVLFFSWASIDLKGYERGLSVKQAEWAAAEKRGKALGSDAAGRAARDVNGGLSNDRFDSDGN